MSALVTGGHFCSEIVDANCPEGAPLAVVLPTTSLPQGIPLYFDEGLPYEKESHSIWSPSIWAFHRLELVRLRPLLPGRRVVGSL